MACDGGRPPGQKSVSRDPKEVREQVSWQRGRRPGARDARVPTAQLGGLFCITLQLLKAETISLLCESTQEPNPVSDTKRPLAHARRTAGE